MLYLLKFGGNVVRDRVLISKLAAEAAELAADGRRVVMVHGGGPEISEEMERRGLTPRMAAGVRVTDAETLAVAEEVLRKINQTVVECLREAGLDAVGIPGYFCTACSRVPPAQVDGKDVDLGLVGDVADTDPSTLEDLLDGGVVPVVYPIGMDQDGSKLNVNADAMAAGIAVGIGCDEMIAVTDVPGVLLDVDDPSSKLDALSLSDVDSLIADGTVSGGMIPKVLACRRAVEAGVGAVRMVDGRHPEGVAADIINGRPHGTVIARRAWATSARSRKKAKDTCSRTTGASTCRSQGGKDATSTRRTARGTWTLWPG